MSTTHVYPQQTIHSPDLLTPPSLEDLKPPYSVLALIAMTILNSPNSQLTSYQICHLISESFPWYSLDEYDWQDSVIHTVNHDDSFVASEETDGRGCHFHGLRPGVEFHVGGMEEDEDDREESFVGMARRGVRGGQARVVRCRG